MTKKGHRRHTWKMRWFVLTATDLIYYESKEILVKKVGTYQCGGGCLSMCEVGAYQCGGWCLSMCEVGAYQCVRWILINVKVGAYQCVRWVLINV